MSKPNEAVVRRVQATRFGADLACRQVTASRAAFRFGPGSPAILRTALSAGPTAVAVAPMIVFPIALLDAAAATTRFVLPVDRLPTRSVDESAQALSLVASERSMEPRLPTLLHRAKVRDQHAAWPKARLAWPRDAIW